MEKESLMLKAIDWVKKRSAQSLKAKCEGYEEPKMFTKKSTNEKIQPDGSFVLNGSSKHFWEIALKVEDERSLVTRWKLLSMMASLKNGKLHLFAPKGHKMFTKRLVDKYNINALIYSL